MTKCYGCIHMGNNHSDLTRIGELNLCPIHKEDYKHGSYWRKNYVHDLNHQSAIIGETPIILTDRFMVQTLHKIKDENRTICNQTITNIIGQTCFEIARPNRESKKCKRCFKI